MSLTETICIVLAHRMGLWVIYKTRRNLTRERNPRQLDRTLTLHSVTYNRPQKRNKLFHVESKHSNSMTADEYQHGLLRKTLEGTFREYGRAVEPSATLEWAIGIANRAIRSGMLLDEVMGILLMVELRASNDETRRRLTLLHARLGS